MHVTIHHLPPLWSVKKGHGSFLTMEMGEKLEGRKKNGDVFFRGFYHLWIAHCDWSLEDETGVLLDSESIGTNPEADERVLSNLLGKMIEIQMQKGSSVLKFSDGPVLTLSRSELDPGELFYFYSGDVVITAQ